MWIMPSILHTVNNGWNVPNEHQLLLSNGLWYIQGFGAQCQVQTQRL
jgi:hypothetical protein